MLWLKTLGTRQAEKILNFWSTRWIEIESLSSWWIMQIQAYRKDDIGFLCCCCCCVGVVVVAVVVIVPFLFLLLVLQFLFLFLFRILLLLVLFSNFSKKLKNSKIFLQCMAAWIELGTFLFDCFYVRSSDFCSTF